MAILRVLDEVSVALRGAAPPVTAPGVVLGIEAGAVTVADVITIIKSCGWRRLDDAAGYRRAQRNDGEYVPWGMLDAMLHACHRLTQSIGTR